MIPDTKETDEPVAVEVDDTQRQAYQEAGVGVQRGHVPRYEEAGSHEEGAHFLVYSISFYKTLTYRRTPLVVALQNIMDGGNR